MTAEAIKITKEKFDEMANTIAGLMGFLKDTLPIIQKQQEEQQKHFHQAVATQVNDVAKRLNNSSENMETVKKEASGLLRQTEDLKTNIKEEPRVYVPGADLNPTPPSLGAKH